MKHIAMVTIGVITLFLSNPLSAQNKFAFEFRGGPSFATQDLGPEELNTGFSLEGMFDYSIDRNFGLYTGWSYNHFTAKKRNQGPGGQLDYEESGYTFGVKLNLPFGEGPVGAFIRGGGTLNHIETQNNNEDIIEDTGHILGWQIAAGLNIDLSPNMELTPGVKYQSLSPDMDMIEVGTVRVDYTYVNVGIGLSFSF